MANSTGKAIQPSFHPGILTTSQSWYSSTVPNRINSWSYDAAGNVTQVGGMTRNFTYDAEDRQASATINSNTSTYNRNHRALR